MTTIDAPPTQAARFDYAGLDTETRIVVRQRTGEIKSLMRRAAQDIIDIGQKLIEVKARLGHGQFGPWLHAEFAWTTRTAQQFMLVAETFKNENFSHLSVAPSALYLLAAPSTPDAAREEALARAEAGERITHGTAQQIVTAHRPAPAPAPVPADPEEPWRRSDAELFVQRPGTPLPPAIVARLAAVDIQVRGCYLSWPTHAIGGAGITIHVLAGVFTPGGYAETLRKTSAGVEALLVEREQERGDPPTTTAAEPAAEPPSHTPPAGTIPVLSGAALEALSRRAGAIGASFVARGSEIALKEPDGTTSRYPLGQEDALARRIAQMEQQAPPTPRRAPPGDLPAEQERAYARFEQLLAGILAKLDADEAQVVAWLATTWEPGSDPRESLWEEWTEIARTNADRLRDALEVPA